MQLQIEAKQKMLGRSVAFGVVFGEKSAEKHLIRQNFLQMTTPNKQSKLEYILPAGLVG